MTQPASGWYPDPSGQPGERWWNGSSWSQDTRPSPAPAAAPPAAWDGFGKPVAPAGPGAAPPAYGSATGDGSAPTPGSTPSYGSTPTYGGTPGYGADQPVGSAPPPYAGGPGNAYGPTPAYGTPVRRAFLARNGFSLGTLGVTVGYLLLLFFAHVAVVGLLPLVLGFNAVRRKEPLGWGAVVLGVLAFVFGIYVYTR